MCWLLLLQDAAPMPPKCWAVALTVNLQARPCSGLPQPRSRVACAQRSPAVLCCGQDAAQHALLLVRQAHMPVRAAVGWLCRGAASCGLRQALQQLPSIRRQDPLQHAPNNTGSVEGRAGPTCQSLRTCDRDQCANSTHKSMTVLSWPTRPAAVTPPHPTVPRHRTRVTSQLAP